MKSNRLIVSIYYYPSQIRYLIGTYGIVDSISQEFVAELEKRLRHDYHDKVTTVVERIY